jgi:hypothetical protein
VVLPEGVVGRQQGIAEGAKVMGSRAKLAVALTQAPIDEVVNIHRSKPYWLGRVGGVAIRADDATIRAVDAYEVAKSGGRHKGLYRRNIGTRTPEIEKAIRSLKARIAEHEDKIAAPFRYVRAGSSDQAVKHLVGKFWPKEITKFQEEIDVLEGILRERK